MKDYRLLWKELANKKEVTFTDCIQRCILLGMHKGRDFDDKVQHALRHLDRSFSPHSRRGYDNLIRKIQARAHSPIFGLANEVLETKEEHAEFMQIAKELCKPSNSKKLGINYTCIFILGDLIPEQIVIQTMHASMLMGQKLTKEQAWPKGCDAANLHYLLVRGDNPGEVCQFLIRTGVRFSVFEDYDYFFDNNDNLVQSDCKSPKSIMTYPFPDWKKLMFDDLELLRFESLGSSKRAA